MNVLPVDCPLFWSAEQAATVVDYLDRLSDAIWEIYGEDIIELRTAELTGEPDAQPDNQCRFEFEFGSGQADYE